WVAEYRHRRLRYIGSRMPSRPDGRDPAMAQPRLWSGKRRPTLAPLGSRPQVTRPPWARATSATRLSPRPRPGSAVPARSASPTCPAPRRSGSKALPPRMSRPGPWSCTAMTTSAPARPTSRVTAPPGTVGAGVLEQVAHGHDQLEAVAEHRLRAQLAG